MELLEHYGMTSRTMHDPIRLERRAEWMVARARTELRVASLLMERAREIRAGEYTKLRVPSVFDADYKAAGT